MPWKVPSAPSYQKLPILHGGVSTALFELPSREPSKEKIVIPAKACLPAGRRESITPSLRAPTCPTKPEGRRRKGRSLPCRQAGNLKIVFNAGSASRLPNDAAKQVRITAKAGVLVSSSPSLTVIPAKAGIYTTHRLVVHIPPTIPKNS